MSKQHPVFKNRYIPKWDSRGDTLTYFVCRLLEQVFGRKKGIKAEVRASIDYVDGKKVIVWEFFTWEAMIIYKEKQLIKFLKSLRLEKDTFSVEYPALQLQYADINSPSKNKLLIPVYKFSVGFGTFNGSGFVSSGTSETITGFTATGSDRAVIGLCYTFNAANTYSQSTFGGTTMTEIVNRGADGTGGTIRFTGLHDAPGTAEDYTTTSTGNMQHITSVASYSGTDTTSAAAAFPNTNNGSGTSTSLTATVTTTVADCWVVAQTRVPGRVTTAGTGTVKRGDSDISADTCAMFDSDGPLSAGANSLVVTWSPSRIFYWVAFSIAPSAGGGVVTPRFLGFSRL